MQIYTPPQAKHQPCLYRRIAVITCLLALIQLSAPILSTYVTGDLECGNIIARGFNLMEFSLLGAVPVLTPCLLLLLNGKRISGKAALTCIGCLAVGNMVSLGIAVQSAYVWMQSIATSEVVFHLTGMLYIPTIIAAMLLSYLNTSNYEEEAVGTE